MVHSYLVSFEINYEEYDKVKYYCETQELQIEKIEYLENILFNVVIPLNKYMIFVENVKNILARKVDVLTKQEKYVKK